MVRTRIKVCGITREEDALAAEQAGCDAIGFVLWPSSPRFVSVDRARAIAAVLSPLVTKVGVFVSPTVDDVAFAAERSVLDAVQLCGPLDNRSWIQHSLGVRLIRAIGLADDRQPRWNELSDVNDYLLDAHDERRHGGTGQTFDWGLLRGKTAGKRIWLAGGLNESNVVEAINVVRPYAVDVSTGVESEPGIKSEERIRAFVRAVHAADGAVGDSDG